MDSAQLSIWPGLFRPIFYLNIFYRSLDSQQYSFLLWWPIIKIIIMNDVVLKWVFRTIKPYCIILSHCCIGSLPLWRYFFCSNEIIKNTIVNLNSGNIMNASKDVYLNYLYCFIMLLFTILFSTGHIKFSRTVFFFFR